MAKTSLGSTCRHKAADCAVETPERRAVPQVIGRRADVALDKEWNQIVAIGAPGSIDAEALTAQFESCFSGNGNQITLPA